jgi:hypothetical protein
MNRWPVLLLVALTVACGEDEAVGGKPGTELVEEPVEACALSVTLSGRIESTIPEEASMGCAVLDSVDSGIDNLFLLSHAVAQFQITIDEVREGEIGADFPAEIDLYDMTSARWGTPEGACAVEIVENVLDTVEEHAEYGLIRSYTVGGTGYCTGEAVPTGQGAYGLIGISQFDFRLPSVWRDSR